MSSHALFSCSIPKTDVEKPFYSLTHNLLDLATCWLPHVSSCSRGDYCHSRRNTLYCTYGQMVFIFLLFSKSSYTCASKKMAMESYQSVKYLKAGIWKWTNGHQRLLSTMIHKNPNIEQTHLIRRLSMRGYFTSSILFFSSP